MGDLQDGSIGRRTTTRRPLIGPVVALGLAAALLGCADNELVVVPETDDQGPTVEAGSAPSTTGAPGSTTTSTSSTSTTASTTTTPSTTGSGDGGGGASPTTVAPPPDDPPPTVVPPPAGSEAVADEGAADRSLAFVNQQRASNGRRALESDADLDEAALDWARQLASSGELGHNPDLRGVVPSRYGYIGENVAYSWTDANIDQGWWESDGHRANILGEHYTAVGIAFVVDADGTYWAVQVFGG